MPTVCCVYETGLVSPGSAPYLSKPASFGSFRLDPEVSACRQSEDAPVAVDDGMKRGRLRTLY